MNVFTTAPPPKHHLIRFPHRVKRRRAISLAALLSLVASGATAGDAGDSGTNAQDHSKVPEFISARSEIPADLLDQKKEGTYWILFPIIGYDPDTLFNIGATVNVFNNGPKDSPFFRYNSYELKTGARRGLLHRRRLSGALHS